MPRINLHIDPSDYDELDKLEEETLVPKAVRVRKAVSEHLERVRKENSTPRIGRKSK